MRTNQNGKAHFMAAPLIGITTYPPDDTGRVCLPREYGDAVRRAGGIPMLISPGEIRLEEMLARIDGLILSGGGDLDPRLYGEAPHECVYGVHAERDAQEVDLVAVVVARGLPTLAVCRGMQVLNVALEGTLIQHLPDAVGQKIPHRAPPRRPIIHGVRVASGSRLATILEATEFVATSWHHQGVDRLGRGLLAVAEAPDGVIEAVESATHRWLFGVQWHPELTAREDPIQQRLFTSLVTASQQGGISP